MLFSVFLLSNDDDDNNRGGLEGLGLIFNKATREAQGLMNTVHTSSRRDLRTREGTRLELLWMYARLLTRGGENQINVCCLFTLLSSPLLIYATQLNATKQ